jgi:hypothetical protein
MEKFYRITVLRKKKGFTYFFIDLSANNAKEAKSNAENIWYRDHTSHAFHVTATPLKTQVLSEGRFSRCDEYDI